MSAGSSRLKYALKAMREKWDVTREVWDDGVSRDFEKVHLSPLEQQVNTAVIAMDKLQEVLLKVRQDVSAERG